MNTFIQFVISHNERIIFIAAAAIGLLSAVVVWWQVFGKKGLKTESSSELDLSDIEETLKKILSQTHVAIGNVVAEQSGLTSPSEAKGNGAKNDEGKAAPSAPARAPTTGATSEELSKLKAELEQRAKIIEDLKTQVESARVEASTELTDKIKTLEGRLAEYEIIEDDIADLSRFKEENAKLKSELEALKRASPEMVDQFAEALAEADASAESAAPDSESAPQSGVSSEPTPEPAASSEPASEPAPDADSPSQFASEVAAGVTQEPSDAAPINVPDVNSTLSEPASEKKLETKGDIFAEFAGGGNADEDPLAALGDIDPDRMLDELKDLNADLDVGVEAVNESPDIDKMAEEAMSLEQEKKS